MEIKSTINTITDKVLKYRRHYKQSVDSPIHIKTYVECPIEWLWPNCENISYDLGDLDPWTETQRMIQEEFPQYNFTFYDKPLFFLIQIETKDTQKTDLYQSRIEISNHMEDKVIGVLVGQAVGNALGSRYESTTNSPSTNSVERDTVNGHLPMLGGGPFYLLPGQITADTELALMIARRFVGVSDVGVLYISSAFLDWYLSDPFDIGNTLENAFENIDRSKPLEIIHSDMMHNASSNIDSFDNVCLMNISPIALIGVLHQNYLDSAIADFAVKVCKLTNPHPVAQDACRVYTMAIRNAIQGDSRQTIWTKAIQNAQNSMIQHILVNSNERAVSAVVNDPSYLGVSLQLAFYELLHGVSFEQSMTRTMSRGGDSDTNGCIVGSLLGAFYGYSNIPDDWCKKVFNVDNPRVEQLPEVSTADLKSLAILLANKGHKGHA